MSVYIVYLKKLYISSYYYYTALRYPQSHLAYLNYRPSQGVREALNR